MIRKRGEWQPFWTFAFAQIEEFGSEKPEINHIAVKIVKATEKLGTTICQYPPTHE